MEQNNSKIYVGYLYGIAHFCIEFICFYIMATTFSATGIMLIIYAAIYDTLAFAPQIIFGYLFDKKIRIYLEWIGLALMAISVISCQFNGPMAIIMLSMTIGNAILHEAGAAVTTSVSKGMLSHSAIFVAGGSFGLVCGQTLGKTGGSCGWNYLMIAGIALVLILTKKEMDTRGFQKFHIANVKLDVWKIITIAVVVVTVRSFVSYAIPISWKKEIWQSFLLFFTMGVGKGLGGILSDKFGAKIIGVGSTLLCIPFLIVGDNHMVISVIGVLLFSMTMSITYGMLLTVMHEMPGVAFGLTTIALVLGILPVMMIPISKTVDIILVIVLSIMCSGLLYISLNGKKDGDKRWM